MRSDFIQDGRVEVLKGSGSTKPSAVKKKGMGRMARKNTVMALQDATVLAELTDGEFFGVTSFLRINGDGLPSFPYTVRVGRSFTSVAYISRHRLVDIATYFQDNWRRIMVNVRHHFRHPVHEKLMGPYMTNPHVQELLNAEIASE